ncbi:MAG: hypothetical protein U9Q73_03355 [Nanoarchaeota archaeon]|nr:hypothetical protein [Nanoarchaeota archaeon]
MGLEKSHVNKFLIFGVLGLFLISMIAGIVSAEDFSAEAGEFAESAVTGIGGFFGTLFEPLFGETEILSRVFFAILLGMIIYSIISVLFKDSGPWIHWGITGAITSLALLGLPLNFLEVVRTQYGAMGAAILTIIPFMIILVFSLKLENKLFARVIWLFYTGYYLSMYLYGIGKNGWFTTESIPYMIAFIVGLFLFFGIGAIRNLLFKGEIEGLLEKGMGKVEKRRVARTISDANLTAETDVKIE